MKEIKEIFDNIAEYYRNPIPVGSKSEANVYYRLEDLSLNDLKSVAVFLAERLKDFVNTDKPLLIIHLPKITTQFPILLAEELGTVANPLEVINLERLYSGNGVGKKIKGASVLLVNEVITTARSSLEAHSKITMMGGNVCCWAAMIDRTFGPGPVPVVTAYTGEPITLIE